MNAPASAPALASVEPLFRPLKLGSLELPNRIVMSPMTRSFGCRGVPDPQTAAYYAARAAGGAGLIVSEGLTIAHPASEFSKYVPQLYGDEALAGWRAVIEAVHAAGGRMLPQLWHAGTCRDPSVATDGALPSWSPSGEDPFERPRVAMSQRDIDDAIEAHAAAAANAQRLGFDGVEIHAGHGYTIDAFFFERLNWRDDRYGGRTLRERTRFASELLGEMRRRVGPDFPIFMRISQWKLQDYAARNAQTPQELADWVEPLADAGVDLFDCSQRRFGEAEFAGSELNLAGWVRKLSGKPTMTVGSVGLGGTFLGEAERPTDISASAAAEGLDRLVEMLERGDFDLVAVGRGMLNNADWAQRVRSGTALRPFTRDILQRLE